MTINDPIEGESSTGFTLFMDTVLKALPREDNRVRLFIPFNNNGQNLNSLHLEGWTTVSGLTEEQDPHEEARRLDCSYVLVDNKILKI